MKTEKDHKNQIVGCKTCAIKASCSTLRQRDARCPGPSSPAYSEEGVRASMVIGAKGLVVKSEEIDNRKHKTCTRQETKVKRRHQQRSSGGGGVSWRLKLR